MALIEAAAPRHSHGTPGHGSLILDALDRAGNIVAVLEPDAGGLRVVAANNALAATLGRPTSEIEGAPADFLGDADPEGAARLAAAVAADAPLRDELRCRTAAGGEVWLEVHMMPATVEGSPRRFVLLGHDVTARHRRAATEEAMQALLAQAFQHAGAAMAVAATNGVVVMANPCFQALSGRPAERIVGREMLDNLHPQDHALAKAMRERQVADGRPYELPLRVIRPDGHVRPVVMHAVLLERRDLKRFRIVTLIENPERAPGPAAAPAEPPRPEPVVLAGRIRLIGLEDVRDALGDRWPAMAERAMACAEHVLRRRLGPRETFSRAADGAGFVVCFAARDADESAFRAAGIAREVRARLIGEVDDPGVATITAVTDPRPLSGAEVAEVGEGLTQRLEQRLSARQTELGQRARDRLAEAAADARCDVLPLAAPSGAPVPLVLVDLPRATRMAIESALLTLPEGETRGFDPTLLRLEGLMELLMGDPTGPAGCAASLLLPVDFESLGQRGRAERCLERLRGLTQPMRARLVPILWQVPEDAVRVRVEDALRLLRPFGRSVGVELADPENPPFDLRTKLANLAVVDAATLLRLHRRGGRPGAPSPAVQRLRLDGLRVVVRHADGAPAHHADGAELAAAGADLVLGDALPPPA